MKSYARIEDGVVVELLQTADDITKMFTPELVWVECSEAVAVGFRYDGHSFSSPTPHRDPTTWETIKAKRDALKVGGFEVGSLWFHSDADSRIQHLGLKDKARDLIAAGGAMSDGLTILGQPVRWKTMSGVFATITAQIAFDIVTAAGDLDARLFAVAEAHRQAMEASADPAAYDFSAGWPKIFGEE